MMKTTFGGGRGGRSMALEGSWLLIGHFHYPYRGPSTQ